MSNNFIKDLLKKGFVYQPPPSYATGEFEFPTRKTPFRKVMKRSAFISPPSFTIGRPTKRAARRPGGMGIFALSGCREGGGKWNMNFCLLR